MKYYKREASKTLKADRIAVVNRTCAFGDAFALRPVLQAFIQQHPDQDIDLFVPSKTREIFFDLGTSRIIDPSLFRSDQFNEIYDLSDTSDRHLAINRVDLWCHHLSVDSDTLDLVWEPSTRDIERASRIIKRISPDYKPLILICPFSSTQHKNLSRSQVDEIFQRMEASGWRPILLHNKEVKGFKYPQLTNLSLSLWKGVFYLCDCIVTVPTSHLWLATLFKKPTIALLTYEPASAYSNLHPGLSILKADCTCKEPKDCKKGEICKTSLDMSSVMESVESLGLRSVPIAQENDVCEPDARLDKQEEVIGLRVRGFLGDTIRCLSLLENFDEKVLLLHSYEDSEKIRIIRDLLKHRRDTIVQILESPTPGTVKITKQEIDLLRRLGCNRIIDGNVLSEEFHDYKQYTPKLGIEKQGRMQGRVCLMRRSHQHGHFPLRNRPYEEWYEIESFLVEEGFYPEIIGLDDPMPNKHDLPDYRGLLSPLQTLERCLGAELIISTATFVPVYTNHYVPTLVLSDPGDIRDLEEKWYHGRFARVFDVSRSYLREVKNCIKEIRQDG